MASDLQRRRGRMLNADRREELMTRQLRLATIAALLIAFACSGVSAAHSDDCFSYEPVIVHLTGKLVAKVFPGRPNYESLKAGDEPEKAWLLHLDRPICMKVNEHDDLNVAEDKVSYIHLVLQPNQFRELRRLMRKGRVKLGGSLFHSFTGHHHARVLMMVNSIKGK